MLHTLSVSRHVDIDAMLRLVKPATICSCSPMAWSRRLTAAVSLKSCNPPP